jgi:acyl carrier protein
MDSTIEVIRAIVCDELEIGPEVVTPEAQLKDIGVDSLAVFDIVFAIEKKLGIKIDNIDANITVFQDLVDMVDRLSREQGKL